MKVKFTDGPDANEKMKDCCPGSPFVIFSNIEGVEIDFVNPEPHNGLFSQKLTILEGDDYNKIKQRLVKEISAIKSIKF